MMVPVRMTRRYCSLAGLGTAAIFFLGGVGDSERLSPDGQPFDSLRSLRVSDASLRSLRVKDERVLLADIAPPRVAAGTVAPVASATATATPETAEEAATPRTPPPPAKITVAPAAAPVSQPAIAVSPAKIATGGVGFATIKGLVEGDSVTGTFSGEAIPFVAGNGIATALFGVDLDVKPGKYMLRAKVVRDGETIAKDLAISVFNGKYPEQSFTVPPEKDVGDGDVELAKRITREAKALSVIWPEWTPERKWSGAFAPPAPGTMKNFGSKRIINGKPRRAHSGADQSGKTGDPIHSINDGTVVFAADQFFGGNTTVIDHGHGLYSMYMHQSTMDVQVGQAVKKGEKIGEVGMTGRATGAHLHWGLRLLGARVDPAKLLDLKKDLDALGGTAGTAAPMTSGTGGGAAKGG